MDLNHLKNALDSHMLKTKSWGRMELVLKDDEKSISEEVIEQFLIHLLPTKIDEFFALDKIEERELGKFKPSSTYSS